MNLAAASAALAGSLARRAPCGKNRKNITNWHFKGTFEDFIIWPASSRWAPLKLRAIVKVGAKTTVLTAMVTPGT